MLILLNSASTSGLLVSARSLGGAVGLAICKTLLEKNDPEDQRLTSPQIPRSSTES